MMNKYFVRRAGYFVDLYKKWKKEGVPDPLGKIKKALEQEHPLTKRFAMRSIKCL